MCRIPPPPPACDLRDFRRWWRSGKCVGFPPTPPPPPPRSSAFMGLARLSRLAAVLKTVCCAPPPLFFLNPGSAPACGCSLWLLYAAHWACLRSPNVHAALPLRLWSSWSCPRYCSEACNRFTIVHWNDIPASFWLLHTTFIVWGYLFASCWSYKFTRCDSHSI